jgi:hypothetical protein
MAVGVVKVRRTDTPVDPKISSDGRQTMFRPQLNRLLTKIPVRPIGNLVELFRGSFIPPNILRLETLMAKRYA